MIERCRVAVNLDGATQYYVRDSERKRDGKYVAVPLFTRDPRQALIMGEPTAIVLVKNLRGMREDPWIEDCKDSRRVEVARDEMPTYVEDQRQAVIATLDSDTNDPNARVYVVKPCVTPGGKKWFLRIDRVPGVGASVIYGDEPLEVLQKAEDAGLLKWAVPYVRPAEPQQVVQSASPRMVRPGDR